MLFALLLRVRAFLLGAIGKVGIPLTWFRSMRIIIITFAKFEL